MHDLNPEETVTTITNFISSYIQQSGTKGAVIGLSGGIDSTITAYLSVKALGKENVLGILLPEKGMTPPEDILDATEVAYILNIDHSVIEISEIINSLFHSIPEVDKTNRLATGNLKARIRMCTLYYYANIMNRIVVGTGNRTEILLGYFTKYGDGGVDIEPLGNLYKTQVRQLAHYLKVPHHIIDKPPSAGLWAGQTDEDDLGLSYETIDNIFFTILDESKPAEYAAEQFGIDKGVISDLLGRINKNQHKRHVAPTP
ncbi:MAG: NAD+ synthase [Methanosarcinales archaeon]|nr:NAD+ synthase [Methanosarcinales archaeon]